MSTIKDLMLLIMESEQERGTGGLINISKLLGRDELTEEEKQMAVYDHLRADELSETESGEEYND